MSVVSEPKATVIPIEKIVLSGISWDLHWTLRKLPENDGKFMTYDRGLLEITTHSKFHERVAQIIARFIDVWTEESDIPIAIGCTGLTASRLWPIIANVSLCLCREALKMISCSTLTAQLTPIYQQPLDSAATGDRTEHRRELETMLGIGILIYQNIRQRHLSWHDEVEANRTAFNIEDAQRVADEYRQWMAASEYLLAQAKHLKQQGVSVDHADEVRSLYDELRLANLNVRELVRRYERLEQGEGIEAGEFFASLGKRESA